MNSMLAVGEDSPYGGARGSAAGALTAAAFALVGLILLYAALRIIRKRHDPRQHRYTLPRH